jgi:hypothetical protein
VRGFEKGRERSRNRNKRPTAYHAAGGVTPSSSLSVNKPSLSDSSDELGISSNCYKRHIMAIEANTLIATTITYYHYS